MDSLVVQCLQLKDRDHNILMYNKMEDGAYESQPQARMVMCHLYSYSASTVVEQILHCQLIYHLLDSCLVDQSYTMLNC